MVFGGGGASGDVNTMYITAGLTNEQHGLFSAITAATPTPSPDFSISASPMTVTITAGNTATFTVTFAPLNGFNSAVMLACSGKPLGSTCSLSPSSVTPTTGGNANTSTLTIMTNSSPYSAAAVMAKNPSGGIFALLLPVPALGLLVAGRGNRSRVSGRKWIHYLAGSLALLFVAGFLLAAGGCGYNANNAGNGTQRGMATVMITGTSGNLAHSTSVSLTVQ
jgi:hypothetical protein